MRRKTLQQQRIRNLPKKLQCRQALAQQYIGKPIIPKEHAKGKLHIRSSHMLF